MKIITSSEINAWLTCPKRWWFRYDQLLVPGLTPKPLAFGRLVHDMLEDYYLWCSGWTRNQLPIRDHQDNIDEFDEETAKSIVFAYKERDPVKALGHKIVSVEDEFRVPLRSPTGRKYHYVELAGKIDLTTQDEYGNIWVWDHKTSASNLDHSWLAISNQMGYYVWANWQLGIAPVGIIYNLIRKPSIKPRINETPTEWGVRLAVDIESRPEFYFQRENIPKSPNDLLSLENELWDVAHAVGRGPKTRNPNGCSIYGCAYRELCVNDTKLSRQTGYRIERAHIELKEETLCQQ